MKRWFRLVERKEKGSPINIDRVLMFMTSFGMKVKKGKVYVLRGANCRTQLT